MARIYPGAVWRPIKHNYTNRRRARTRAVICHVDGGNAKTLFDFFNAPGRNASSHFYVTRAGVVEQYVDADLIAWTSGDGNATTIGIETQGAGDGKWTPEQFAALAKLLVWVCAEYDIPAAQMPNSKPSSVGIGTHRLGVNGNFALTGVQRGRIQRGGGELWSSARGKICPGYDRQAQWPVLVSTVAALIADTKLPPAGWYHTARVTNGTQTVSGYAAASTQSKVKHRRQLGFNVYIAETVTSGKTAWGVTNYGTHYKMSKLKRGKAPTPAVPPAPGWFTVTGLKNSDRLNGRAAPTATAKILHRRKNGFHIYATERRGEWIKTRYGTWYHTGFLKKGKHK